MIRMRLRPRRPSSFWKGSTRIAASAATRKWDSRPASASANHPRGMKGGDRPEGSLTSHEVDSLHQVHRRRFRIELRGSAEGALGFFSRKRLSEPVHGLQRVEPAYARRLEEHAPACARTR